MAIKITYTDEDKRRITQNHSEEVAQKLADKIEQTNKTLTYKSDINECGKRFQSVIQSQGYFFPEVAFDAHNRRYRAILYWYEEDKKCFVVCVVEKEDSYMGSRQDEIITMINKNGQDVAQNIETEHLKAKTTD